MIGRINVTRLGTDEVEAELQIEDALRAGQQHTVLARVRLRKGGQGHNVKALLFIPPHRSTGVHKALGQVSLHRLSSKSSLALFTTLHAVCCT